MENDFTLITTTSQQRLRSSAQLLLCGIIITSIVGCDPPSTQKHAYETLVFQVDQTRLEPAITDTMLEMTIAAPKGWKKVNDSMLAQVIEQSSTQIRSGAQVVPRWIFLNESSRAMCIVSTLNGADVVPDETLLKTLETAYRNQFPDATVKQTIFMKDAFRILQLMLVASDFVLIKLICDSPENIVFEVDYHIPRKVYETELRAIESSIGSINLITH